MIERDEIIFLIETLPYAVQTAQQDIERLLALVGQSDNIAEIAAGQQLKAKIYEGIGGGRSNAVNDIGQIYELARKTKEREDMQLVQEVLAARERFHRVLVFARVFNQSLTGLEKSVLIQRYQEHKRVKEIIWQDEVVSWYRLKSISECGIKTLQKMMEKEGFDA